jgi:hypothetical protein
VSNYISGIKCSVCKGVIREPTPELYHFYEVGKHPTLEDCIPKLAERINDLESGLKYLEREVDRMDCPREYRD